VHVPANAIVLLRVGGAAAFFLPLAARAGWRVPRADLPRIVLCALLGVVANQLLFVNGLARTTAVNATVLGSMIPVFTAVTAMLVGREKPRARRLVGIGVAFSGTLLLVRGESFSFSDANTIGDLLIVANSLAYACFLVLARTLASRVPPLSLVALLFGFALPFVAPFGLWAWSSFTPTATDAVLLAGIVLFATIGAYGLNQFALQRADASLVAVYIYLQPVIATTGAVLFLGERPGVRVLIAGVLILLGLAVSR
jgi:drug/metabolite transporter (DMT)-like permease